jgi:hypothetical protein
MGIRARAWLSFFFQVKRKHWMRFAHTIELPHLRQQTSAGEVR